MPGGCAEWTLTAQAKRPHMACHSAGVRRGKSSFEAIRSLLSRPSRHGPAVLCRHVSPVDARTHLPSTARGRPQHPDRLRDVARGGRAMVRRLDPRGDRTRGAEGCRVLAARRGMDRGGAGGETAGFVDKRGRDGSYALLHPSRIRRPPTASRTKPAIATGHRPESRPTTIRQRSSRVWSYEKPARCARRTYR
jgi:hypothetical protein